ncbi:hypothetical protein ZWY2020_024759 [Hordeum vulgare]|nr:hypothetical protein ZWY2020_024759 [Hordeum vulgare]
MTPSPPANRFLLPHTTRRRRRLEAVRKGNAAVGVRGTDTVVLGVEKKSTPKLQDSRYHRIPFPLSLPPPPHLAFRPTDLISPTSSRRSMRKIASLDMHIALACTGLKADTRVLINRSCVEFQSHRLTVEDPVTVEYITRYIAGLQQKYTQSGGVRPFGLSTLILGFDPYTDKPALYQTDPSGTFSSRKANTTGRNSNSMREFLEKNYKDTSGKETIKLTIRVLLEDSSLIWLHFLQQNVKGPLSVLKIKKVQVPQRLSIIHYYCNQLADPRVLSEEIGCGSDEIIGMELNVCDTQPSCLGGGKNEFIYSGRLDNLASCYCALKSIMDSSEIPEELSNEKGIRMIALFGNEEVGSNSMQAASAPTIFQAMRRIVDSLMHQSMGEGALEHALTSSFLVSDDMAHALHPNYPDKHEEYHRPELQKGLVIKHNANQHYATSVVTAFLFKEVARIHNLPVEVFSASLLFNNG